MRKYYQLWCTLRERLEVTVRALPAHHKRINKAVVNEKHRDVDFKRKLLPGSATLSHGSDGEHLTLKLTINTHTLDGRMSHGDERI